MTDEEFKAAINEARQGSGPAEPAAPSGQPPAPAEKPSPGV
jgi:hypothetical protein